MKRHPKFLLPSIGIFQQYNETLNEEQDARKLRRSADSLSSIPEQATQKLKIKCQRLGDCRTSSGSKLNDKTVSEAQPLKLNAYSLLKVKCLNIPKNIFIVGQKAKYHQPLASSIASHSASKEWPTLPWTFPNHRRNGREGTDNSDFTCLLLITKPTLRARLPRVPIQDWVPGAVGIPTFHCRQCLQHWKMSGDLTEKCDQPKDITHGPPMFISRQTAKKTRMFIRNAFTDVSGTVTQLHVSTGNCKTEGDAESGQGNAEVGTDRQQSLKDILWEDHRAERDLGSGLADGDAEDLPLTSAFNSMHVGRRHDTAAGNHSASESDGEDQAETHTLTLPAIVNPSNPLRVGKIGHHPGTSQYSSMASGEANSDQVDCFGGTNKLHTDSWLSKGHPTSDEQQTAEYPHALEDVYRAVTMQDRRDKTGHSGYQDSKPGTGSGCNAAAASEGTPGHQLHQDRRMTTRQGPSTTRRLSNLSKVYYSARRAGMGGHVGSSAGDKGSSGTLTTTGKPDSNTSSAAPRSTSSSSKRGRQSSNNKVVGRKRAAVDSKEKAELSERSHANSKQQTFTWSKSGHTANMLKRRRNEQGKIEHYSQSTSGSGGRPREVPGNLISTEAEVGVHPRKVIRKTNKPHDISMPSRGNGNKHRGLEESIVKSSGVHMHAKENNRLPEVSTAHSAEPKDSATPSNPNMPDFKGTQPQQRNHEDVTGTDPRASKMQGSRSTTPIPKMQEGSDNSRGDTSNQASLPENNQLIDSQVLQSMSSRSDLLKSESSDSCEVTQGSSCESQGSESSLSHSFKTTRKENLIMEYYEVVKPSRSELFTPSKVITRSFTYSMFPPSNLHKDVAIVKSKSQRSVQK